MSDEKSSWPKWALFAVGALALSAIPVWLAFSHAVKGLALPIALFAWFVAYLAYVFIGTAKLKAGQIGPVMKRYRRRLAAALMSYCVVLMGSIYLLHRVDFKGPLLWLVAAAPAAPILAVLVVMGLYLKEEPDEFERAVHVEAMIWGLGVVLAVTTVWGFLSNANVVPAPPLFLVFPLFCVSWGLSQPFIRRRYQ